MKAIHSKKIFIQVKNRLSPRASYVVFMFDMIVKKLTNFSEAFFFIKGTVTRISMLLLKFLPLLPTCKWKQKDNMMIMMRMINILLLLLTINLGPAGRRLT